MPPEGQHAFAQALLTPDLDVPQNIVDPEGRIAPKRFAVYRNNVIVSLIDALGSTFPAVKALVGEDFFNAMAREFARKHPPQSPLLFEYGSEFPAFVAGFEPASTLLFLGDVATLDRAWLDAYHAADAKTLDPTAIAMLEEEDLAGTRFTPQPAMGIVASQFPVVTIWQAAREGKHPQFGDAPKPETALVVRPDVDVQVYALTSAEGVMFAELSGGMTLGEAAETAQDDDPDFDFAAAMTRIITSGAFSSIAAKSAGDDHV